jgi:hypothetical protein
MHKLPDLYQTLAVLRSNAIFFHITTGDKTACHGQDGGLQQYREMLPDS